MTQPATKPDKKASLLDWAKALFKAGNRPEGIEDADLDRVEFTDEKPVVPAAPATEPNKGDEAKFAVQQAENEGLRAVLLTKEAEAFYSQALADNRVVPAEKDALIAQFTQAVKDDAKDAGVACFSADGAVAEGVRLKALKDGVAARVPHGLTTEQIAVFTLPQAGDVEPNPEAPTAAGKAPSAKRVERLAKFSGIKEAK
jgi:hypothetical protein